MRVGIAITFLWISVLIFKQPESWGGMLQPWAASLLPIPLRDVMMGVAGLDFAVGFFLLVNKFTIIFAALGFVHVATLLIIVGINAITVRDIAIGAGLLALVFASWPESKRQ